MHPAFSVIFLTTLIGAGQGLFLALYTTQVYSKIHLLEQQHLGELYAQGSVLAVILLFLGLFASFFHLGHPERAWRAASQWRTSWLSREVIVLPLTIGLIALYGVAHYLNWNHTVFTTPGGTAVDITLIIGLLTTISTFALFVCTGMIYASLRFLAEWFTPLTVINYILLGAASGFTLATVLAAWQHHGLVAFYAGWAIVLTVSGLIFRSVSLFRNKKLRPKITLKSAIGLRHPNIVQKSQGSMGGSFNTREYFHGKTPMMLAAIKYLFIIFAFLLPIAVLFILFSQPLLNIAIMAFAVQYTGLIAERWYFFADANHPQNLYYQSIA